MEDVHALSSISYQKYYQIVYGWSNVAIFIHMFLSI